MAENEIPHFSKIAEEMIGELRGIATPEPRKQKLRGTQTLATVVDQLVTQYQIGRDTPEQIIRDHWVELVGTANAGYSHAARLENGGKMLVVIAPHSVVRNELFHHRQMIVDKIRKLPGCGDVKMMNLRAG